MLFAAGAILFPSCKKELSCEGPECRGIYDDGKAVYSFVQSNGSCTNGSHFTITSVETYTDAQARPIAKVKASFNCLLYNYAVLYKVLTNGEFYGEFTNFLR